MGYAQMQQRGQGLHLRQFSRAFIVDDDTKRVVFVSVDGAMISHPLKRDVSIIWSRPHWSHGTAFFGIFHVEFLVRIGGEETATPLWKYLSNGKCCVEWNAHPWHTWWLHDASSVRYVNVWLCARDLSSFGVRNFQGKHLSLLTLKRSESKMIL